MSATSSFSLQLLSKIGAPLAQAVEAVMLPAGQEEAQAAERMAAMLSMAVEMSIALYDKLDVTEDEKQADETRTALAGIAADLIAEFYTTTQKLPETNDKDRLLKSMEAVLNFSDKFSKAGDAGARLMTLGNENPLFDVTQSKLVTLQSMADIINAVSEFPFGQSETKLIQDITERLENDAARLAKENGTGDTLSELMIFKSLTGIYAQCHRSETVKAANGAQEGTPSLDPVWAAYDMRLAMMNALVGGAEEIAPAPAAPTPPIEAPVQTPVAQEETPVPAPAPAPAAAAVTGGPMGFFAAKKTEDASAPEASAEAAPPATPPATPPLTPPAPVEAPPAASTETSSSEVPAPETPPTPSLVLPAEDAPTPPAAEAEKPAGEAGNPMSFFKGPPKTEEGE